MSTLSPENAHIQRLVYSARRTLWLARLLLGLLSWLGLTLTIWIALFWLDNLLHLPASIRLALSLAGISVTGIMLWRDLLIPIRRQEDPARVALLLEQQYQIPQNLLINSLQFENRRHSQSRHHLRSDELPFAANTILAAVQLTAQLNIRQLWQSRKIIFWLLAFALVAGIWTSYATTRGALAYNAYERFSQPLADIPPAGSVKLTLNPDNDIQIPQGDDLDVSVRLTEYQPDLLYRRGLHAHPQIIWTEDQTYVNPDISRKNAIALRADPVESGVYHYLFNRVRRPFAFRIFAADTYSRSIYVSVNTAPTIAASELWITPPPYTMLPETQSGSISSSINILPNSKIRLRIKLSHSAQTLDVITSATQLPFILQQNNWWECQLQPTQKDSWQIEVQGTGLSRRIELMRGTFSLINDRPPHVAYEGLSNYTVNPGHRMKLLLTASDDLGLRSLKASIRSTRENQPSTLLKMMQWNDLPGQRDPVKQHIVIALDSDKFLPGESYLVEATATDHCPKPNHSQARPILIQIRGLNDMVPSDNLNNDAAWRELDAAIEAQQSALGTNRNSRANLPELASDNDPDKFVEILRQHTTAIAQKQKIVGDHLTRARSVSHQPLPFFVQKMDQLNRVEQKKTLDMIHLVKLPHTGKVDTPLHDLKQIENLQAFILSRLIALKGDTLSELQQKQQELAQTQVNPEMADNMMTETMIQNSYKSFTAELDNFINKQKEIIHERSILPDHDAQDFSQNDEDRLEELALDQSRLAEMLSSAVNDFTKIDLQDFGDDAMVHEMTALFEEAEKLAETAEQAADNRQARVDAYRLETQAVEMAEELEINCEATFGGSDDIQFIAETAEDEQLSAPLAELPTELEDMVGDLATTAEDMRPEVEDIGSYLNSLDHTAGPISDGTIASMSAKGKTGNQKPEDNVIQGRSGAGRSGMAEGQMVESTAKDLTDNDYGLRERMSSTPLESGEVKDEDVGAQTGATGLGKLTDQASIFGPGGKLPPEMLNRMKSVRQQLQSLIKNAQQAIPQLNRHNLTVQEMDTALDALNQMDDSLQKRNGIDIRTHYSNAVNALRTAQTQIGQQIAVQYRRESTKTNPLDTMLSQKVLQRYQGYEHMIGAYFEAITQPEPPKTAQ